MDKKLGVPQTETMTDQPYPMLELSHVHVYYGESHILHGASLAVGTGEVVGLLGRNGAGKTTTIRAIMGFTPPRTGSIRYLGRELRGLPPHQIARAGIALVPQGRRIFPELTVQENLLIALRKDGPDGWDLEKVWQTFPRLRERWRQQGGSLSGGEQQMLAIARALVANPRLVLMDEPSEGLAPAIVQEIGQIIQRLKQQGLSILLVEQNLPLAMRLTDRVYVMNKGQIVFQGHPQELWARDDVHMQYLGV